MSNSNLTVDQLTPQIPKEDYLPTSKAVKSALGSFDQVIRGVLLLWQK